jgi:hypothetical protein
MTLARSVSLITYELLSDGQPDPNRQHNLQIELKGIDRFPITSTGVIPAGTWGNIPGGEVFVAPLEHRATGTFSLNGAFKDHVIAPNETLILEFDNGFLSEPLLRDCSSHKAFGRLLNYIRAHSGFGELAELGIGVNDGIHKLTGSALFDEKCNGTAHIALGDNRRYGGANESDIHEDLITWAPTIAFDGQPILCCGQDALDVTKWRESIESTPVISLAPNDRIMRNDEVKIEKMPGGGFRVRRDVAVGRVSRYSIGDRDTNARLKQLLTLIPDSAAAITDKAWSLFGLNRQHAHRGIEILLRHRLVYRKAPGE